MNIKKIKLLIATICGMILIFIGIKSYAISVDLSQSSVSLQTGQSTQISVTGNDAIGNISVSSSQSNVAEASLSTNWLENSSATLTISAKSAGSATITISGKVANSAGTQEVAVSKTINVNVTNPATPSNPSTGNGGSTGGSTNNGNSSSGGNTASSNANLSNLGVVNYDFTGFKPGVTSYNTTVPNNVTSVSIYASVQAAGAVYNVSGNNNLDVGTNKVTITVTAPDKKTTKNYYIYVARQASGDDEVVPNVIDETEQEKEQQEQPEEETTGEALGLLSIAIDENYEIYLEPEFKTDIYEYKINLKEDIDKIPFTAIPNRENAKVEITGNENLKEGENTILITVTDEEKNETVEYKIIVNKVVNLQIEGKNTDEKQNPEMITIFNHDIEKKWVIVGAIVAVIVILLIIVFIVIRVIKRRRQEDYEYEENWNTTDYNQDYADDINDNQETSNENLFKDIEKKLSNNQEGDNQENLDNSNLNSQDNSYIENEYQYNYEDQERNYPKKRSKSKGKHF